MATDSCAASSSCWMRRPCSTRLSADLGRLDAARGAPHQLQPDRLLQLIEPVADVRAAHLEPARGLAEIAGVEDLDQQGQRIEVHSGIHRLIVKRILTACKRIWKLSIRLDQSRIVNPRGEPQRARAPDSIPGDTMSAPNPSAAAAAGTVTRERRDKVLVVTVDHPPVNALSADVRRGLAGRDRGRRRRRGGGGGADRRRGPQLHRRRRHPRIRQAAAAARAARGLPPHRGQRQAGGGRAARRDAGRRPGSGARRPLPPRPAGRQAGPARSAAGPAARRRRHAARAAPDRRGRGARPDAERPPCRRRGRARAGPGRSRRGQ